MWQKVTYHSTDGKKAYLLFGYGAIPGDRGVFEICSRSGSADVLVGVLEYTPSGTHDTDGNVALTAEPGSAMYMTTLIEMGSIVLDGFDLHDARYLYVEASGDAVLDVSFVPSVLKVTA